LWELYRYPNGIREFLQWYRNDVPNDYPYNLEKAFQFNDNHEENLKRAEEAWRPAPPTMPPPGYTGKMPFATLCDPRLEASAPPNAREWSGTIPPPEGRGTRYGFHYTELHSALAGKDIVSILPAQTAVYTGNAYLEPSPWSYSGGINIGLWFRSRPPENMNPTAIVFTKPEAAKHVAIIYTLQEQLWSTTLNDISLGLYESGIRTKTVKFSVSGRGYGDNYGFVLVENVNVQAGNEVRLQLDGIDVAYNTRLFTPNYTNLGIDYIILYND
jgi:hypothetical protein